MPTATAIPPSPASYYERVRLASALKQNADAFARAVSRREHDRAQTALAAVRDALAAIEGLEG